jgi:glycosyltransferase involved in cell wall biosynthesis
LAAIPDHALVLVDGLAYGVMDAIAEQEHERLHIVALCHHPLALETGLSADEEDRLFTSEKKALALACAVVVTSAATAMLLTQRFGIAAQKITVALPGTRKRAFAPCQGDPPRLLTVASLTRRKAHDVLIQALAHIKQLTWTARIVGGDHFDPAWSSFLKEKTVTLELDDRIHFAGSIDDLSAEYTAADVFVLPSRFEGYGMVFAEALAAGLPIIAARAGAVPDVVPESAGLLVPPDDTGALTAALRSLLTREDVRRKLQAGARKAAANLPAWADSARRVADLIEDVRTG